MAYDAARDGAGMAVTAVERLPTETKKPESLLDEVEKHTKSPEQRFAELKTRLQEVDATLVGADQMIEYMKEDLQKIGELDPATKKELGEDGSAEAMQLVDYISEIDQARAEKNVLEGKLQELLTGRLDEARLKKGFEEKQAAADLEHVAQREGATLDQLGAAHAEAVAKRDHVMADHLEGEMAKKYTKLDPVTIEAAQRIAAEERASEAVPKALDATAALSQAPDVDATIRGVEAVVIQPSPDEAPPEASVVDRVEIPTAGMEARRAEFSALSAEERDNTFTRLMLQRKWSQEAAGGAVTDEARVMQKDLYLLARLIRADIEASNRRSSVKDRLLKDWNEKVQALSQDPTPVEVGQTSPKTSFNESMTYSATLAKSARFEIDQMGGTVTERAKAFLREAIQAEQKQLAQIRAGEADPYSGDQQGAIRDWTKSISELQALLGEKPTEASQEGEGGIDAAEGKLEIMRESREMVAGEQLASVRHSIDGLNEFFQRNKRYTSQLEDFSDDLGGLTRLSGDIDEQLDEMQRAFESNPPDQAKFDQLIVSVGEGMDALRRRAAALEEEFSALGSGLVNAISNHSDIFDANDGVEVAQLVRTAHTELQEISETVSRKRRQWQPLEEHLSQSGRM